MHNLMIVGAETAQVCFFISFDVETLNNFSFSPFSSFQSFYLNFMSQFAEDFSLASSLIYSYSDLHCGDGTSNKWESSESDSTKMKMRRKGCY